MLFLFIKRFANKFVRGGNGEGGNLTTQIAQDAIALSFCIS